MAPHPPSNAGRPPLSHPIVRPLSDDPPSTRKRAEKRKEMEPVVAGLNAHPPAPPIPGLPGVLPSLQPQSLPPKPLPTPLSLLGANADLQKSLAALLGGATSYPSTSVDPPAPRAHPPNHHPRASTSDAPLGISKHTSLKRRKQKGSVPGKSRGPKDTRGLDADAHDAMPHVSIINMNNVNNISSLPHPTHPSLNPLGFQLATPLLAQLAKLPPVGGY